VRERPVPDGHTLLTTVLGRVVGARGTVTSRPPPREGLEVLRPPSVLGALGLEVAGVGLPVPFEFSLALEGVALDLAGVLDGDLVAVELRLRREGHLAVLV